MLAPSVAALFLLINMLTADRSPTVWQDEVMFLDPAANLAEGRGFRSTFWAWQSPEKIFTANAPLYSLILAGWIKIGAVEPGWVRSLNFFLAVAMVGILGLILITLIESPANRPWELALFYFLSLGWGSIAFSYRSGRYDMLCGLLLALVAYGLAQGSRKGLGLAALCALLCPWAGLQTLVVLGLGMLVAWFIWKQKSLAKSAVVGLAAGIGLFTLLLWAWAVGGLETFVQSVRSLGGQPPTSLVSFWRGNFRWDWALALAACVALSVGRFRSLQTIQRWALGMGVLLPAVFGVLGKYPIYYSYLAILPLLFLFCSLGKRPWSFISLCLLCASVVIAGLPARIGLAILEWNERSSSNLAKDLTGFFRTGDQVLTDYAFYYIVRNSGSHAYGPQSVMAGIPERFKTIISYPDEYLDKRARVENWILVNEKIPKAKKLFLVSTARLYGWRIYRRPDSLK